MNEQEKTETAVATVSKRPMAVGPRGLEIQSLDDIWRLAQAVAKSGFAPKGITSPEAIMVAVQMGLEVGLTPMASLQNIAVINGRPSIYGDAALAVVRASGLCAEFYEAPNGRSGDDAGWRAVCRRTDSKRESGWEFTIADAKRAGLWGKEGPWRQYPERMLMFRARAFALRDAFGDVLKGLRTVEEMRDTPPAIEVNGDQAEIAFVPASRLPDDPKPEPRRRRTTPTPEPTPEPAHEQPAAPAPAAPEITGTPYDRVVALLTRDDIMEDEVIGIARRKSYCKPEQSTLLEFSDARLQTLLANWDVIAAQIRIDRKAGVTT